MTWNAVAGFDSAKGHRYQVRYKNESGDDWTTMAAQTTRSATWYIAPGQRGAVNVAVVGVNTSTNGLWADYQTVTRPLTVPGKPTVNATINPEGGFSSSASAQSCQNTVKLEYQYKRDATDWSSWRTSRTVDKHGWDSDGGSRIRWRARCSAPAPSTLTVVGDYGYTDIGRPASSVNISSSGSGLAGTNVTFNWSSSTAEYFIVTNSNGSVTRYSGGTANSITVRRESGSTCAKVYGWRSSQAREYGASAVTDSVCATTTQAPAPDDGWSSGTAQCKVSAASKDVVRRMAGSQGLGGETGTWQVQDASSSTCRIRGEFYAGGDTNQKQWVSAIYNVGGGGDIGV